MNELYLLTISFILMNMKNTTDKEKKPHLDCIMVHDCNPRASEADEVDLWVHVCIV